MSLNHRYIWLYFHQISNSCLPQKIKVQVDRMKRLKMGFSFTTLNPTTKKREKINSLDIDSLGVWYLGATFWIFYILCTWNVKFCSYLNCDVGFLSKQKKPDDQNLLEPVIDVVSLIRYVWSRLLDNLLEITGWKLYCFPSLWV